MNIRETRDTGNDLFPDELQRITVKIHDEPINRTCWWIEI